MAEGTPYNLTDEENKAALAWLAKYFKGETTCPVCKTKKFTLDRALAELRSISSGNYVAATYVYTPCLVLKCKECGYVMLFNAKTAGIRDFDNSKSVPDLKGGADAGGN